MKEIQHQQRGGRASPDAKPGSKDTSRANTPDYHLHSVKAKDTLKTKDTLKNKKHLPSDWKLELVSAIQHSLRGPVDVPREILHSFRHRSHAHKHSRNSAVLVSAQHGTSASKALQVTKVNGTPEVDVKFDSSSVWQFMKVLHQLACVVGGFAFLRLGELKESFICIPMSSKSLEKIRSQQQGLSVEDSMDKSNGFQIRRSKDVLKDLTRSLPKLHSFAPEIHNEDWMVVKL
jgi:hypothetical protein